MADEEEGPTRLTRSFSARMRRKEQVARGEAVPDMPEDSLPPVTGEETAESDEEAALSDEELLAKYGVDDPEAIAAIPHIRNPTVLGSLVALYLEVRQHLLRR